jgi:hypothetical protein
MIRITEQNIQERGKAMTTNTIAYGQYRREQEKDAEQKRHNLATEYQTDTVNTETKRHNLAQELFTQANLVETQRANQAKEDENRRHNLATEEETAKHNLRADEASYIAAMASADKNTVEREKAQITSYDKALDRETTLIKTRLDNEQKDINSKRDINILGIPVGGLSTIVGEGKKFLDKSSVSGTNEAKKASSILGLIGKALFKSTFD